MFVSEAEARLILDGFEYKHGQTRLTEYDEDLIRRIFKEWPGLYDEQNEDRTYSFRYLIDE